MGDPTLPHNSETPSKNQLYKKNIVGPKSFPLSSAYDHISSLRRGRNSGNDAVVGKVAIFLLKVAALETVRRVSRSKCPFIWRGIQALQLVCYPPFKWIQRWGPFKGLVQGVQMFSRPLLVISVATTLHDDQSSCNSENPNATHNSDSHSETNSESRYEDSSFDARTCDAVSQEPSENWLVQLHKELENQGIALPERINEDELRRFYVGANGDFSSLLTSIKKTIRWRESYRILSKQELKIWSTMVFWHGFDVQNRPCLFVRLGLACMNLQSHERPRFAQAVISQVEHGMLHLVDEDSPHITVLLDCDGISPLKIPMQMMRSCSSLLQDNFPNCLGLLLVIQLPPVVRVLAQTFIQVLKPVTRKKLRIEGKMYHRVLSEYLQTLPSYLGGNCNCDICSDIHVMKQPQSTNEINMVRPNEYVSDGEELTSQTDHMNDDWNHLLRTAVIGILMVWIFIALIAGMYDS